MNYNKIYKLLLKIVLCIYPSFLLTFAYNSYFTLLQIIIIFGLLLFLLLINKESRKNFKYIILYTIIVLIYGIFHHLNATNFTSLVPGNFNYDILKECLQILKMSIPVIFVYLIYHSNLEKEDYIHIIKSWIILICGSIIISNILKISLSSYTGETIKANIFSWFNNNYNYRDTASIGFFKYSNQISCLLVIIMPMVIYYYIKEEVSSLYIIIMLITLLMLGTRVATVGGILVFIAINLSYIFFNIIKKEKTNWKKLIYCLIFSILYLATLPFSPAFNRHQNNYLLEKRNLLASIENVNQPDIEYIKSNYEYKLINEEFILNRYPYEYDPKFWLEIMNKPQSLRTNYRYLEIEMIKRVKEINNNKWDDILGITNVRVQNIFNIERDYILQYYAFGILGCILFLSVYFCLFVKNIKETIKNFNYLNTCILSSIILLLTIAYMSGNIYNQLAISIPILFSICIIKNNDYE